ncbi:MAG: efflux RND transporter permease subunit [Planctomycetota bacterium]
MAALVGLARLEFDDLPRGVIRSDDGAFQLLERLQADFGSDDNDHVLVLEADDWFTPELVPVLREAEARAWKLPGVERVNGVAGVVELGAGFLPRALLPGDGADAEQLRAARERALEHPLVGGSLLSPDGRTTLVVVRLAGGDLTIEDLEPSTIALRELARELERHPGVRARVTGVPAFRVEIFNTIRREQILFMALGAVVCLGVAFVLLRSVRACLVVLVPPAIGSVWVLGGLGLTGQRLDLLGIVLPVLFILIAFTDTVHLVIDVRRELARGQGPLDAAHHAIRTLGMPCFLTSITTAVGFGSLTLGGVPMIRNFGFQAMAGVLVIFVAVLTTLPLAVTFVRLEGRDAGAGSAWIGRLVDAVTARPRRIGFAGVAATVALVLACFRLVPENRLTEATPQGNETYQALRHCEEAFGGLLPLYVLVEWERELQLASPVVLAATEEAQALLGREELLSRPLSALSLIELLPGSQTAGAELLGGLPSTLVQRFVREDSRRAVVVARVPDLGTPELQPLIERIEAGLADIEERSPGVELSLTGTDVVARRNVNRMISDLARGLAVAALVIFGVIALEFRSLRLGLLSLLPNVFPLAVVGGLLVATGRPLQMVSAVLFTVLLGIAVDDTIHLLSRYRREVAEDGDVRAALRRTGASVGAAILTTTVVLVAGYSVVFLSSVPTNHLFAALICVGLCAAFVGDLLLLPALLAWWRRDQTK